MTLRWRLFPKYALVIIALVGGMLLASGAIGIYFSWREIQQSLVALQVEKAQSAANRIEQYILSIEDQIGWTAFPSLDANQPPLEQRRIEFLKLLHQVPAITEVAWIDPKGREQLRISRLSMDTVGGGADRSREPVVVAARAGSTSYSGVYFRKETEPYMTIARPAADGGVTAAEVNLKFVLDVVSRIRVGEHGLAWVVDSQGTLIAHPDISLVLKKTDLRTLPQVAALLQAGGGATSARALDLHGAPVLSAHAAIPTLRWTVFVESPESEAFAPLYASIARAAAILGAGLLISVIASFFVARALVRPLHALEEGAARIGAGELDRRIEVHTGDEVERLAEQFNKMGADLKASYADLERKVEERTAELSESLEQQTATAEVLKVISSSVADTRPVFDKILDSGQRLFAATGLGIYLVDSAGMLQMGGFRGDALGATGSVRAVAGEFPRPLERTATEIAIRERRVVHYPDVLADPQVPAPLRRIAEITDNFSIAFAPMLWEDRGIGAIQVSRDPPSPFTDKELALLKTFADQAVIAIQNSRLFNETREALEQQTATAEVLQVISSSVADSQPVFEKILESCAHLLTSAQQGILVIGADGRLHLGAHRGDARERLEGLFPVAQPAGLLPSIEERRVLNFRDILADPDVPTGIRAVAELLKIGTYSQIFVPMLWEGRAIGSLYVIRQPATGFSEKEIGLLLTFADQAVIAIQNARLFNETREALERQTATSEVLAAISGAQTDATGVFETIVRNAHRLSGSVLCNLLLYDGKLLHMVACAGFSPEQERDVRRKYPVEAGDASVLSGRVVLSGCTEHIEDAFADPRYDRVHAAIVASRRMLGVPMLREGAVQGVIVLAWREPGHTPPALTDLLKTFADQAVIAIENVRLFNETREALERQTATAEILRVISGSPGDVTPVFEAIAQSAYKLLGKCYTGVLSRAVEGFRLAAMFRGEKVLKLPAETDFVPLDPVANFPSRVFTSGRMLHIPDWSAIELPPHEQAVRTSLKVESSLMLPLMRGAECIAVLFIGRDYPQAFSDKEIALAHSFVDQATVAIENTRLFNETREALEQQKASSEVLGVISNSMADAAPVFDSILRSCERLFGGTHTVIDRLGDDRQWQLAAYAGPRREEMARLYPAPLGDAPGIEAEILKKRVTHIPDVANAPDVAQNVRRGCAIIGCTALAMAPMLSESGRIGTIIVGRKSGQPFTAKEMALLQTFADQAVIAIQNARLFNETREALEQQTATAEVLQVISSSVADAQPVFDKILDSCTRLFVASGLGIYLVDAAGMLHSGGFLGETKESVDLVRAVAFPFPRPLAGTVTERAIRERRVIHFSDVLAAADAPAALHRIAAEQGNFSIAFAPMLWEGRGVGAIHVSRHVVQPFTDKELALLKTFADQAVIAIQNARLFNEIQDKSRELEAANRHKSEFLANMSHELRTPLNAIIGFSEVLGEKMFGEVNDKQLEYLHDIHSSGHHLLSLINDILDLSKIEAGRMELELASINLPMLLDNCTTLVRERASRQGLALALEVEDGVGDWVADVRKVKQVVINLLANAVKFTPAGGRVTLRARRTGGGVEIAVIDTGVGIAADQQALVFEEFRQASGDYLRKGEGTGLGLSLARRFVELHGGSIRVESAPGRGSTFAFILPERVLEAL